VRLFLDAHFSGPRIAERLREAGHDVRAADEERVLDSWTDEALLDLATSKERIMVTFNKKDFPSITRRWAEAGRRHAGCAVLVGIDHSQIGVILRTIEAELAVRPRQEDWQDHTAFVSRTSPG
jgi:hypothetical protein